MAKPIKTLELHYPMIQFLIKVSSTNQNAALIVDHEFDFTK